MTPHEDSTGKKPFREMKLGIKIETRKAKETALKNYYDNTRY